MEYIRAWTRIQKHLALQQDHHFWNIELACPQPQKQRAEESIPGVHSGEASGTKYQWDTTLKL